MARAPAASPRKRPPSRIAARRAHGRSLGDFPNRNAAERLLLRCCALGTVARVSGGRPAGATKANSIRAGLVRFLALGGDDRAPVHEHGVQLEGAWLVDPLDLEAGRIACPLALRNCRIEQLSASRATIRSLDLRGSHLIDGLYAPWLTCEGGLHLGGDFLATATVMLGGASVKGDFIAVGGHFENPGGDALMLDNVEVRGNMFLCKGFRASGEVRLLGAVIDGILSCADASFENPGGDALSCHIVTVSSIYLHDGFKAVGGVHLTGAKIRGSVECQGGSFLNAGAIALSADRAEVSGSFFFRSVSAVQGQVHLTGMTVGSLCDDIESWSETAELILDGFTYGRLSGDTPTDAKRRIGWLKRQRPSHLQEEFKPQPWEHLISVLKTMGHLEEARKVAVAKHRQMRAARRYVGGSRLWDWIYGSLVGYGFRPWSLLRYVLIVWAACALLYWPAANPGLFGFQTHLLAPVASAPDTPCLLARAAARSAEPCPPRKPRYQDLFLPAFSAEVLIPVLSLGQKGEWRPRVSDGRGRILYWGWALAAVYWFEIVFGWLAGLLLVAAVGNLVKKD